MSERATTTAAKEGVQQENPIGRSQQRNFVDSSARFVHEIFFFQQTLGNQAVQRLFQSGAIQPKLSIGKPNDMYEQEADRVAEQVMNLGVEGQESGGKGQQSGVASRESGSVQAKLKIGQPDDVYEQEADRVVERVMRMPEKEVDGNRIDSTSRIAQSAIQLKPSCPSDGKSSCEEEEEAVQTKPIVEQITPLVQRKNGGSRPAGTNGGSPETTPHMETRIQSLPGNGQPLPDPVRAYFEPRFGCDFSSVRVHKDSKAEEFARAVNAKAFTLGKDIVFGEREYAPETDTGRRLLAHELSHTIQQQNRSGIPIDRVLQRAVGGSKPDRPALETTSIDITGRYEVVENLAGDRITLQVNQAGRHIEGWWQQHTGRKGSPETISMFRLRGELTADAGGRVLFSYERSPEQGMGTTLKGTLTGRRDGDTVVLTLSEGYRTRDFTRSSPEPRLSEQAIASSENPDLVRAAETVPLDEAEEALLRLTVDNIQAGVTEYFRTNQHIRRVTAARELSRLIAAPMDIFVSVQRPLAVRRLREHLTSADWDLTVGTQSLTLWDWLQDIVTANPSFTVEIQRYLGLLPAGTPGSETLWHKYRWRTEVWGLSGNILVGLGGFWGKVIIEKLEPDRWTTEYFTAFGQLSAGPSAGVQIGQSSDWSNFQSRVPWTSGNFQGRYEVFSGSAGGAGIKGVGGSAGSVIFYGDGAHSPLHGDAGGGSVIYGVYVGAEGAGAMGYLRGGKEEAVRASSRQSAIHPESSSRVTASLHFEVNDPSLTPAGRIAVREMCALHRAAFESVSSSLRIDGYASTKGPEARNEVLARLRAENTLQAIRDVLGNAMSIFLKIQVEGHGERAAAEHGEKPETENVEWRRVDVVLNGKLILALR